MNSPPGGHLDPPAAPAAASDRPTPMGSVKSDARVFDSRLEEAHEAAAHVRDFCMAIGCDEIERQRVELCVYEAFVNAVEHAYHGQPGHEVRVMAEIEAGCLKVRVCQRGVPLDPARVSAAPTGFDDVPVDLDVLDCEARGRGLRIIKAIMSVCEVESDGDSDCLVMGTTLGASRG